MPNPTPTQPPVQAPVLDTIASQPIKTEVIPEKVENKYGNFDLLDDITPEVKTTPSNPVNVEKPIVNDIMDLGFSQPEKTQVDSNPVKNQNNYDLDLFGNDQKNTDLLDNPVEIKQNNPISLPKKEPEFLPDDTIWINERELDNSGRDGIKVFGKWFLKLKTKLFLKVTIWNKSTSDYRSPRLDIKENYYGVLFLNDGVGVPLNSIKAGEFLTIEKGRKYKLFNF